jgi:hypothetical protein
VTGLSHAEWFAAENPDVLLNVVRPPAWPTPVVRPAPATVRRLQLFGCACARTVWDLLPPDARTAVAVRERFADGRATETDLRASALRGGSRWGATAVQYASVSARCAAGYRWDDGASATNNWDPADAARNAAKARASKSAGPVPSDAGAEEAWHAVWNAVFNEARRHQAELFRDVFPPPGSAPALRRDWLTTTVVALARQMDATGDFSAVPILADALQDAGCDDDRVLDRCRAPSGVHCRGNWVVDLVLGRE